MVMLIERLMVTIDVVLLLQLIGVDVDIRVDRQRSNWCWFILGLSSNKNIAWCITPPVGGIEWSMVVE